MSTNSWALDTIVWDGFKVGRTRLKGWKYNYILVLRKAKFGLRWMGSSVRGDSRLGIGDVLVDGAASSNSVRSIERQDNN